jgi:putative ABC transport system ATP-binding protein
MRSAVELGPNDTSSPEGGSEPSRGQLVLEAAAVDVEYGSVRALAGVSVQIAQGEWIAITGPSGSGKSTLLQLFAALDQPTRGAVTFHGNNLGNAVNLAEYRRNQIGLVFQLHNLLPHLDAVSNVEIVMFGNHLGRRVRRARALRLLASVDVIDQAARKPPELSGGERQRVAIARSLANSPAVLLADEPTGSLDPASVARVMDTFARLHEEEGTTIVMVTHDSAVARQADRMIRIESGSIVGQGNGGEAKDRAPAVTPVRSTPTRRCPGLPPR